MIQASMEFLIGSLLDAIHSNALSLLDWVDDIHVDIAFIKLWSKLIIECREPNERINDSRDERDGHQDAKLLKHCDRAYAQIACC